MQYVREVNEHAWSRLPPKMSFRGAVSQPARKIPSVPRTKVMEGKHYLGNQLHPSRCVWVRRGFCAT